MSQKFAFFDADGTLLACRSMFSFELFYLSRRAGSARGCEARHEFETVYPQLPREVANRRYYARYRGREIDVVQAEIMRWHATLGDIYIPSVVDRLLALEALGVAPVLLSGSSIELLRPFAHELGIEWILATRQEKEDGFYTGRILPPQTIGAGKRLAAARFLAEHGASPEDCYAFGDHCSDFPLLEWVGHPTLVTDDTSLQLLARRRSWPVISTQKGIERCPIPS